MQFKIHDILRYALLAGLLWWGTTTFFQYMVVPVHQIVMLSDAARQQLAESCPTGGTLCIGIHTTIPAIARTIQRMAPLAWYFFASLLIFFILIGSSFLKSGRWNVRLTLSPFRVWGFAFLSLWLIFTVISNGLNGEQPFRRIYYPSTLVYPSAGPQTIAALVKDYEDMRNRGCLHVVGVTDRGIEVADVKQTCAQSSFIRRVGSEFFLISYLILVLVSLGSALLRLARMKQTSLRIEAMFSVGVGACAMIVLLWTLAVLGVYTRPVGWVTMLLLPLLTWRQTWQWIRTFFSHRWTYAEPWYEPSLLLGWLLVSYLMLNFLTVVRPFPIGWDDLGVYLNDPRLLVSYGHAIPRMPAFQWEYLTSLGFLLFGYDSYFGATTSMLINWMAGLLAMCSVYVMASTYLGHKKGFVAALAYYTLPLIGHFSFADMKVDNAVFTMAALSVFAVFLALFPHVAERDDGERTEPPLQWLVLAGLLAGFAFAFKETTIMVTMALIAVLTGTLLSGIGFIGAALLACAVFVRMAFNVADFSARVTGSATAFHKEILFLFFVISGLIVIAIAYAKKPKRAKHTAIALSAFIGCMVLAAAPWLVRNNILAGNAVPRLQMDVPNTFASTFVFKKGDSLSGPNTRMLEPALRVDPASPACNSGTSKSEELDRYWGYKKGWSHYLTLPWRTVMNADSAGYYVTTMPALLLFPLLLLLPVFWTKKGKWLRWLFFATMFMIFEWVFLANGVPWYGIGMFLGLAIGLEALVAYAPDRATKIAASVFIALSFCVTFANRFWQFEQQRNLYDYAFGVISAEALEERTIPFYGDIHDIILERGEAIPDRPYAYRIGTFIPYFIPKNLEAIPVGDHQLDMFSCLYAERDAALTVKRLKALGFNSMIFDTNTHTIERDPNGTLHKKVAQLVNFLNTPNVGIQIVVNDPGAGLAFVLFD